MTQIINQVEEKEKIFDKLSALDETKEKINNVDNEAKKSILIDIKLYRKSIIKNNLRKYTAEKYFTGNEINIIKSYKPYYIGAKNIDIKADIHINYLENLEKRIKEYTELNEEASTYKTYIYVLYAYLKNKDTIKDSTETKLQELDSFSVSKEYKNNIDFYNSKYEKLINLEKINPYSKNDFSKIYSKIIKEKISPGSDYMKGFLTWYAKNKIVLGNSYIAVSDGNIHSKQKYNLSCEANSAKDFINILASKKGLSQTSEDEILSLIPSYTGAIGVNSSNELAWHDPNKVFVGDVNGKQSTNINNFTGYGVYANPIIEAMNKKIGAENIKLKKMSFDKKTIFDSLISGNPVMFWYLSKTKIGKSYGYNKKSLNWRTPDGGVVSGYIGEHTGVIIGIDISKEGEIENIHFVEGRSEKVQKMSFEEIKDLASYFNETIVIDNKNNLINGVLTYSK